MKSCWSQQCSPLTVNSPQEEREGSEQKVLCKYYLSRAVELSGQSNQTALQNGIQVQFALTWAPQGSVRALSVIQGHS